MTRVVLTGVSGAFGTDLAAALVARGLAVDDSFAAGTPDAAVVVIGPPTHSSARALVDLDAGEWRASVDDVIAAAMGSLQAAYAALSPDGGSIVVVTPTIAFAGAAGLVPYVTAVEGVRAMAKSAARQWAADGVTVNVVAVPIAALAPDVASLTHLPAPALGSVDVVAAAAASIAFLIAEASAGITGATVVADGGSVMTP